MRKLPVTAAEDLLELVMRRYERHSTVITSNQPMEDWGKVLGDARPTPAPLPRRHLWASKLPDEGRYEIRGRRHKPPALRLGHWPVLRCLWGHLERTARRHLK